MATKTINIDGTRAYALLKKAVERKGADYTTPAVHPAHADRDTYTTRCLYTHKGRTHCPVGVALSIAGVTLAELDGAPVAALVLDQIPSMARVKFSGTALDVFDAAQRKADRGYTWGEALAAAYKYAPVAHEER